MHEVVSPAFLALLGSLSGEAACPLAHLAVLRTMTWDAEKLAVGRRLDGHNMMAVSARGDYAVSLARFAQAA